LAVLAIQITLDSPLDLLGIRWLPGAVREPQGMYVAAHRPLAVAQR
jgi:hypothetical protein